MPESAEEIYARVVAEVGEGGRLPVPPITEWATCPWDGDVLIRPLEAPVDAEPERAGEGSRACPRCADPDARVIWQNERWTVGPLVQRSGLPLVLLLETREHMDFTDLDDELAAECGRITVWLTRIVESLPGIARCHVGRWGEGADHLHVWFFARPERLLQLRGSFALEWDDILPPGPEDVWRADLAYVARHLASHDGRVVG